MYAMFRVLRFQIKELLGYDDVFLSFFLFPYSELEERQWDSSTSRYVQLVVKLLGTNRNDDF